MPPCARRSDLTVARVCELAGACSVAGDWPGPGRPQANYPAGVDRALMMIDALTGRVPPANGVMVNADELPAGFLIVSIELTTEEVTKASPVISDVPVARPTTV
jgi:hypothetical protein